MVLVRRWSCLRWQGLALFGFLSIHSTGLNTFFGVSLLQGGEFSTITVQVS